MAASKRATIYFDPKLHRELRTRAAASDISISEYVNDAVREMLREDEEDLAVAEARRNEPKRPYEEFRRELKRRGKL